MLRQQPELGRDEIARIDRSLEAAIHARSRDRERRIHRPFELCVGAGKVHDQPVFLFFDLQTDAKLRVVAGWSSAMPSPSQ